MATNTVLNETMLNVMSKPEVKEIGLKITLTLVDGSKRTGIYQDLVTNPQGHFDFKDTQFVKLLTNKPEKGLTIYMPTTQITSVEWDV